MTATSVRDTGEVPGDEPPHALIERRGAVLIVTMNRPAARNALTGPMMALIRQAWDLTDSDPGIRVCVLTGAEEGPRAFAENRRPQFRDG